MDSDSETQAMTHHLPLTTKSTLLDLADLVVSKIVDLLVQLTDLKTLRLVCSTTKKWVEENPQFYLKSKVKIESNSQLNALLDENCTHPWINFYFDSVDFKNFSNFSYFLDTYGSTMKALQIHNYPFKSLDLSFLSQCANLTSLELIGAWAIRNFCNNQENCPHDPPQKLNHLVIHMSCAGLPSHEFDNFAKFLQKFQSLQTLKLHCDENQQLLFRQIASYLTSRYPNLQSCIDHNELESFTTNPESTFYPELRKLCEFSYELEFSFITKPHSQLNSTVLTGTGIELEQVYLSSITDLKTITIGHNVAFPFYKLANIKSITIHLSKFDFLPNTGSDSTLQLFPNLKRFHLTLEKDFELRDLEKATTIFGQRGKISEIGLQLPNEDEIQLGNCEKGRVVAEFLNQFENLRRLSVNTWFLEQCLELVNNWEILEVKGISVVDDAFRH